MVVLLWHRGVSQALHPVRLSQAAASAAFLSMTPMAWYRRRPPYSHVGTHCGSAQAQQLVRLVSQRGVHKGGRGGGRGGQAGASLACLWFYLHRNRVVGLVFKRDVAVRGAGREIQKAFVLLRVVVEGGPGLGVLALDPGRHPSAGGVTLHTATTGERPQEHRGRPQEAASTLARWMSTIYHNTVYVRRDTKRCAFLLRYSAARVAHLYFNYCT